jgi:hypothetical protein
MPDPKTFEGYFHERAKLAESLFREGWRNEAYLVATAALESLCTIRDHDHRAAKLPGAVRFTKFVQQYSGETDARKIAVVFLAEDLMHHGPGALRQVAVNLLTIRAAIQPRPEPIDCRESPHAHRDCDWSTLVSEEPQLAKVGEIEKLSVEYTYPALLYRFYRCSVAHTLSRGSRAKCFSGNEPEDEISYFPEFMEKGKVQPISLQIGLAAVTRWLRTSATGYAAECTKRGSRPADGFDASSRSMNELKARWKKVS